MLAKDTWITISSIVVLAIIIFSIWIFKKNKSNKLKKMLLEEKFFESEVEKRKFIKKVESYFNNLFIGSFNIKMFYRFFGVEIQKNKNEIKNISWHFFILLTTSVVGNESKGKVSEAVNSLYDLFQKSKELLFKINNYNLIADVILKILNLKIRPILTWTRDLPQLEFNGRNVIDEKKLTDDQKNKFWKKLEDLREDLIENKYLRFIAICSLSTLSNEDITKLINYKGKYKESCAEIKIDEEINESIEKINSNN